MAERAEIAGWLTTGMCPAGPMDRAAAPCGVLAFMQIVLLGGWAAFIVVPLLAGWTLVATLVLLGSRASQLRGMRA